MKTLTKHIQHYLPLVSIIIAGVLGFSLFSYDRVFQFAVSIAIAVAYVVWGIIHHYLHRDLHLSVVVEYLVIAVLGLVVIFSLLFRA